ncbi:mechanosensitive ion channel family protein [Thiosulfativibrio zosterae]|uniref:Mechanosensitive ion channel protein MscS n=1 Tax=Thiosulfativibrio zosterae TaxID=2675053 RepID=A0A6F8PN25_9GAMM|nr:mechanosensitive ion channel family protein [Thiosulfativibrio zosterae]BBP43509.1 mechanosensitive ion channel protein MscS [Thiosulfativibrio zosterae]
MEMIFPYIEQNWPNLVAVFGGHVWLLIVMVILTATLVIDLVTRTLIRKTHYLLARKKKHVLDAFVDGSISPVSFFIWVNGSVLALSSILTTFQLGLTLMDYVESTKSSVLILALGWYVIRVVNRLEGELKLYARHDEHLDEVTVEALVKIIKLTAFVITGLIILSAFHVNLTGLLAFGGMGGVAVGFAAKDLLGNIFGGLMIYMDKPFVVGEWIRSPNQELEGTVEKIGWRMTIVRTFDKRPLYIPNGTFSNISIENPSRMSNRRIKEIVGVRYNDVHRVKAISDGIREMLKNHPEIDTNQTLIVNFLEFSASSLNLLVYTFTKTTDWVTFHHIKEDVLLKIAQVIEDNGGEIAFPTRTLHLAEPLEFQSVQQTAP